MARKALVTLAATIAVLGSAASAHAAANLALTLPADVDAGAPISGSFTASGLPKGGGGKVVLQRQMGTKNVWKTVAALSGAGGPVNTAGVPMGVQKFRVAYLRGHRKPVASRTSVVRAYSTIPLGDFATNGTGVLTQPTSTFSYIGLESDSDGVPNVWKTVTNNTCRSVHLDIAVSKVSQYAVAGTTAVVSVLQESADPVSTSVINGGDGVLDAALVPGQSWSVTVAATNNNNGQTAAYAYFNGTASCYAKPST